MVPREMHKKNKGKFKCMQCDKYQSLKSKPTVRKKNPQNPQRKINLIEFQPFFSSKPLALTYIPCAKSENLKQILE